MTPEATTAIRVFAVDDHEVVRLGLKTFLDVIPDIAFVGSAGDGQVALHRINQLAERGQPPDVVLMDLVMRGLDGIALTAAIKKRHPEVDIIALTGFGEAGRVYAALEAGATGYVLKDADVNEIVLAIRAAHRGEVHLDPAVARTLTRSLVAPRKGMAALTARERDVAVLVGRGRPNREIATSLSIGERTVQTHLSNVLKKLGLSSRTQVALWVAREGLVELRGPN
jgi:DNA-binding NarL/FixJ family response regulator